MLGFTRSLKVLRALASCFAIAMPALFSLGCSKQPVVKQDRFTFERDPASEQAAKEKEVTRIIRLPSLDLHVTPIKGTPLAAPLRIGERFRIEFDAGVRSKQFAGEKFSVLIKQVGPQGQKTIVSSGSASAIGSNPESASYAGICSGPNRAGNAMLFIVHPRGEVFSCPVTVER